MNHLSRVVVIAAGIILAVGPLVLLEALIGKNGYEAEFARIENKINAHISGVSETLGAFNPSGGKTYRLYTSLGSTDTSIRLSSFKEPISDIPYTMSYLNTDIGYGTLDPQSSTRKEFVSFTGITQNSDGSATLTGVTRGLSFSYPFTASTTLRQQHPGQSIFILSDSPQLFEEYAKRRNNEWITGVWGFVSNPTTTAVCSNSYDICNKGYLDGLAVQGAATSTETTMGIAVLATANQMGSSTASTSQAKPLVLSSRYATTSPITSGCLGIPCLVASYRNALSPSWFNTGVNTIYNLGALLTTNSSSTNATSTNQYITGAFHFTSLPNKILKTNSAGLVSGASTSTDYQAQRLTYSTTTNITTSTNLSATSTTWTIPAGTITASSTITFRGNGQFFTTTQPCTFRIRTGNTNIALLTLGSPDGASTWDFTFDIDILFNNSVSSQISLGRAVASKQGNISAVEASEVNYSEDTSSVDFTGAVGLNGVIEMSNNGCTLHNLRMIVDP